jgi:hypothetical protein
MDNTRDKDSLRSIEDWFKQAKPHPKAKDQSTQLGVHFEEVGEMLDSLVATGMDSFNILVEARVHIKALANLMKRDPYAISVANREEFLDSVADQIVTAVGSGYMHAMDVPGAAHEVDRSNWSKFVDGKPIFDENRKIMKGPGYFKPSLAAFIN